MWDINFDFLQTPKLLGPELVWGTSLSLVIPFRIQRQVLDKRPLGAKNLPLENCDNCKVFWHEFEQIRRLSMLWWQGVRPKPWVAFEEWFLDLAFEGEVFERGMRQVRIFQSTLGLFLIDETDFLFVFLCFSPKTMSLSPSFSSKKMSSLSPFFFLQKL